MHKDQAVGALKCMALFFFFLKVLLLCVQVSCLHVYAPWCLKQPEASAVSSGAKVTASCEAPCGCWGLNSDPTQEQHVLLPTEPALQAHCTVFLKNTCLLGRTLSHRQAVPCGKLHGGCHETCSGTAFACLEGQVQMKPPPHLPLP